MRDLWRMALWGLSAAGALILAVYAGTTTESAATACMWHLPKSTKS